MDADIDPRREEILDIVAKETGVERARLTPDASITELEIPSLDLVQAIFALETQFGVEIPVVADHAGAEFSTVGELVRHVMTAIETRPA